MQRLVCIKNAGCIEDMGIMCGDVPYIPPFTTSFSPLFLCLPILTFVSSADVLKILLTVAMTSLQLC